MSRSHLNAEQRLVAEVAALMQQAERERDAALAECLALRQENRALVDEIGQLRQQVND